MQKVILTCVMHSSLEQGGLESRAKKNPEILTFVGLPDFLNCYKNGGSCGIRTYDQLVKSQLLYQLS